MTVVPRSVCLCILAALAASGTATAQKTMIVVRHGENKMDTLTEAGLARAGRIDAAHRFFRWWLRLRNRVPG